MRYSVTPVVAVDAAQERLICEALTAVAVKDAGTVGGDWDKDVDGNASDAISAKPTASHFLIEKPTLHPIMEL